MNKQEWHGRPHRQKPPRFPQWWVLMLIAAAFLQIVSLIRGINGWTQNTAARRATEELRAVYHDSERVPTLSPSTAEPVPETPVPTAVWAEIPADGLTVDTAPDADTAAAPTPIPRLKAVIYPSNPARKTDERFLALQQKNRDIIGWLTVGKIVDEPVLQRDNEFYMDHDTTGNSNPGGAVFLDENVSLQTRPWGMVLYGHNMRDGSMFGRLRNYENEGFYSSNRVVTFDTAYENGSYVVFAAGVVNVENENADHFLDIFGLTTRNIHEREQAIETLRAVTPYACEVDVGPEDQLLLLVTCVGNEEERRVVAARRIREGES